MWRKTEIWLTALFAALLAYTLLRGTVSDSNDWLLPGAAVTAIAVFALRNAPISRFRRLWPLLVLPACIAIQLLPWPVHSVAVSLTVLQLARVVVYLVCFAAIREIAASHPESEWKLLAIPLTYGCLEAVFGIAQHAMRGEDNYAIGTFGEHSHFAGFMELLLPLSIVYALRYRQLLALAPPMILFAALLHSFSRAGLVASALAMLAMVLIRTRKFKMAAAAAAVLIVAGLLLAPSGLGERFQRISTYRGFRSDAHLARWQDTLKLIAARPLFGSGAGTYPVAFAPYNTSTEPRYAHHADNDYLQLLAEIGIAGTLATLALLAYALRRCVQNSRWNLAALGCAGSMIALLAHSVFEFQMYIPANVITLAWIAGVGCGVRMSPDSRR